MDQSLRPVHSLRRAIMDAGGAAVSQVVLCAPPPRSATTWRLHALPRSGVFLWSWCGCTLFGHAPCPKGSGKLLVRVRSQDACCDTHGRAFTARRCGALLYIDLDHAESRLEAAAPAERRGASTTSTTTRTAVATRTPLAFRATGVRAICVSAR